MLNRRSVVRFGLAAAGALTFPRLGKAQTAALDVAGAKAEGKLTYYSSTNPAVSKVLADQFNKRYPEIHIDIVRLATGPLSRRYSSEIEAGTVVADILQMGDTLILEDGYKKGWFIKLSELEAHKNWPEQFKTEYAAIVSIFPNLVTFNTTKVKATEAPKSWSDLLDPKWRNQLLMADLRNVPQLLAWAVLMQDTFGPDFLPKLRAQNPRVVSSTLPGSQMVAAGEGSLIFPNQREISASLIEKGAPLDDVMPTPASGWASWLAVSAKAPHPKAARLFTSYILSEEGQKVLTKGVAASALPNIEGSVPLPKDFHLADLKVALGRRPEILKLLGLDQ